MEIKVIHACGTKFKFEVEPEDGAMPFAIQCPSCGEDATEDANAVITQTVTASATAPPPTPARPAFVRPAATPAGVTAAPPPPPPPPPAPKPGLSLGSSHGKPAPATEKKAESAPAAAPAKSAKKGGSIVASDEPHLPLAITGAFIGAAIGMGLWYAMIHYLHFASGWVAWGVGVLAGFGSRALGRAPTQLFGVIAAVFALLGILGGSYMALSEDVNNFIAEHTKEAYEEKLAYAKKMADAKDDAALRAILSEEGKGKEEATDAELARLKTELPRLKDFAAGKPSKAEFQKQEADKIREVVSMAEVMKESFGIFSIIFILLGLSSAYKIGSGMGS